MKEMLLTKNQVALLDDEDYWDALALGRKWQCTSNGYARTTFVDKSCLYLHRFVMEHTCGPIPPDKQVDHINRDKLDCRRANLRLASILENSRNRNISSGITGFLGVSKMVGSNNYRAYITIDERQQAIGCYPTAEMAAYARDLKAKELFENFAVLNDVPPCELTPISNRVAGMSGYKGIRKRDSGFLARAKIKGIEHHLGVFKTAEEAIEAREQFLAATIRIV
jgi:hypothetical protein